MPRYETNFQQFSIAQGQLQQHSDLILAFEPASTFAPEARKGRLYIIAEATHESGREREACLQMLRTLRKAFYEDSSYSIPSSLRKAINKANSQLYQQNFTTAAAKRSYVGVTCAVIKEQRLFIAQVLPSQSYLLAEGKLRALPQAAAWAGGDSVAHPKPNALGASLTIEPSFYQATLRPGDTLLLCSSSFAPALRRDMAEHMLRSPDTQAIINDVSALSRDYELDYVYGMALRMVLASRPADQPAPAAPAPTAPAPAPAASEPAAPPSLITSFARLFQSREAREQHDREALRDAHALRERQQLSTLPEDPPRPPREDLRVRPIEIGASLADTMAERHNERMARLGHMPQRPDGYDYTPSSFLGEGDYIDPREPEPINLGDSVSNETFTSYARRSYGEIPNLDPTLSEQLAQPFGKAAASLRIAWRNRRMRKQLPPRALPPKRRRAGLSYRKEGPQFQWMALAMLVMIVALLVMLGYNLQSISARQQQNEVLDQARQSVAALRNAPDEQAAQNLLERASIALESVRSSGVISDSALLRQEFLSLEREYDRVYSSVERISYLDSLEDIGHHPQAESGNTFASVVIPPPPTTITNTQAFESIYALDNDSGVIYQMPKGGGEITPLLRPNEQIANGVMVGRIKAIAWRFDNLVAVGQAQGGYMYYFRNGGEWSNSNLGGSSEWRAEIPRLRFVTYDGNLYFWGASANQIFKYASGRPGDLFSPWITDFGTSDTSTAVDLAIDRQVYLLQPDGRVQIFTGGAFQGELPAPKVEPSIAAASNFMVTGDDPEIGSIFYLEQGRVIQVDKKTGALIQQMQVRANAEQPLDGVSSFTVDTSGPQAVLYLVNHGHLLRTTVPQPPRPFQPEGAAAETATPAP